MHVEPLRNGKLTALQMVPDFHSPNSSFLHSLHPQSPFRLFKFHLESGGKKGGGVGHLNGYAFILGGGHFKIVFGTQGSMCAQARTNAQVLRNPSIKDKGNWKP